MGKPAARTGDLAGHGGAILIGSTNVFIGGMPAARKGDSLACPIHGVGVITQGSTTVLINGMPAARMTDLTGCMTFGLSAISIPLLLGPPALPAFPLGPALPSAGPPAPTSPPASPAGAPPQKGVLNGSPQFKGKSHDDTDNKGNGTIAIHAEGQITDTDNDGSHDTIEGSAEAVRMRNQAYGNLGGVEGGVTNSMDVFYVGGKGTTRTGDNGYGASGSAEIGMLRWGVGASVGEANSEGRNPALAVGAEGNLMRAKAEGDILLGNDGNRTGFVVKGEAIAEAVQGEVSVTRTSRSIFGYNAQAKGKASGALGDAGGGAGFWLYYDHTEGRVHLGVSGKLGALLLGAGLEGSVSVGREYQAPPPSPAPVTAPAVSTPALPDFLNTPGFGAGGLPGTVLFGCMNVLIGG